jgi:hypothetical protein
MPDRSKIEGRGKRIDPLFQIAALIAVKTVLLIALLRFLFSSTRRRVRRSVDRAD